MAIITKYILGERCPTKEAVKLLELGGVLECIPHEVDPDARLTNAAVTMRRSEWWWNTEGMHNSCRGALVKYRKSHERGSYAGSHYPVNECSGEINAR